MHVGRGRRDRATRLLWEDAAPASRRYEKSVAALAAVAFALERNRPLDGGEDEFLAMHAAFDAADRAHRRRVWSDPQAHFWVRRAYQLVATCVGGAPLSDFDAAYCAAIGAADPHDALRRHLSEFARFLVALHLLARRRLALPSPWIVRLPLALPATPLAVAGDGTLALHGVASGRLHGTHDGVAIELSAGSGANGGPALVRAPVVRVDTAAVTMQPYTFALPGFPFGDEIAGVPIAYQEARVACLRASLGLVRRHEPRTFRTLARTIRVLAFKPRTTADFANLSHSELPGAIVCSFVDDAHVVAASIIHEVHHNRLFMLEEMAPLFDAAGGAFTDARFYSPWREDLRPLQGIFHAVYVYVPVLRFWRAAVRHFRGDALARDFLRDRLARIPVQLRIGIGQLRRHARFTRFGTTLFRALERDVAALDAAGDDSARALTGPAVGVRETGVIEYEVDAFGRGLTVRDALAAHLAQCDVDGQCTPEDAGL